MDGRFLVFAIRDDRKKTNLGQDWLLLDVRDHGWSPKDHR